MTDDPNMVSKRSPWLCEPSVNLTQIAMFMKRVGYTKAAAQLLMLRVLDLVYSEPNPEPPKVA